MTEGRIREADGRSISQCIRYDRPEHEPPSIAVATALAQYYDEDVLGSSIRLYDYVDPEALDALFTQRNRSGRRLEFAVGETTVIVRPTEIEVCPA